jgi:hypothetical protein
MAQSAGLRPYAYVLAVPDLPRTARHFEKVLGFRLDWADGTNWQALTRDSVRVMIGHCPDALPPAETGDHRYMAPAPVAAWTHLPSAKMMNTVAIHLCSIDSDRLDKARVVVPYIADACAHRPAPNVFSSIGGEQRPELGRVRVPGSLLLGGPLPCRDFGPYAAAGHQHFRGEGSDCTNRAHHGETERREQHRGDGRIAQGSDEQGENRSASGCSAKSGEKDRCIKCKRAPPQM